MRASQRDDPRRSDAGDLNWNQLVLGTVVPEPAAVPLAPAHHVTVVQHGTRVLIPTRDARRRLENPKADERYRHRDEAIDATPVAQFTVHAVASAMHSAVARHRTRVVVSCRDALHVIISRGYLNRCGLRVFVPVTELSLSVKTPAPHPVIRLHRARMRVPQSDALHPRDVGYLDWNIRLIGAPVPQSAVEIISPAPHRFVREQRARMIRAQRDARRRRDVTDLNRSDGSSGIVVPELAVTVSPPAPHRAVSEQGTRVFITQRHARHIRDGIDLNRRG